MLEPALTLATKLPPPPDPRPIQIASCGLSVLSNGCRGSCLRFVDPTQALLGDADELCRRFREQAKAQRRKPIRPDVRREHAHSRFPV